ncbi:MAG: right-handed parallel beta-helix repeat-containing protein [Meiothermus sp.]|nr:right-handed parallel beta-helix repeat-containing protein [Meiothermus sp.]
MLNFALILVVAVSCMAYEPVGSTEPPVLPPNIPAAELPSPAAGGRYLWVDQGHLASRDTNPGTQERPWRSIRHAITVAQPGDVVVIRAGTYRERLELSRGGIPGRPLTLAAFPGDAVTVSGADVVSDWRAEGSLWWTPWTLSLPVRYPSGPNRPSDEYRFAARREQVIQDGRLLDQVARREDLRLGSFWVQGTDERPERIYVMSEKSPAQSVMELSTRERLLEAYAGVAHLNLIGLTFRHSTSRIQDRAVKIWGDNSLVQNVTVEWTNAVGIGVSGLNNTIRRSVSRHNGQMGWGGDCEGCVYEDVQSIGNNWKFYDPFWEGGGGKFTGSKNLVFRRFFSADNDGPGLWFDETNESHVVEDSRFERNLIAGVKLELNAQNITVQRNRIRGTRFFLFNGDGIEILASQRNRILNNTITGSEGAGISLAYDENRRVESPGNQILGNTLVANRTSVWFRNNLSSELGANRFDENTYWQSGTFFRLEVGGSFWQGNDIGEWRRRIGSDENSRIENPNP